MREPTRSLRAGRQRRGRQPPDRQSGACRRRRLAPARQGLDARGLAPRRLGLVAPGRRPDSTYASSRLRRRRHARARPGGRRLRGADDERERARRSHRPERDPPATRARRSPGRHRASTAARPSRATGSIATRARTATTAFRHARQRRRRFADTGLDERHDLLLQGVRAERQRRGPALEPGVGDPVRRSSPRPSRCRPSTTSTADREPALGRRPLVERGQRLGRDRPVRDRQPGSPARRRRPARPGATPPSTAPTSRSGRASRRFPATNNQHPPARTHPAAGHLHLRRLHAAPQPACGNRPDLVERVDNGAVVNRLTVNQELAAGDILLLRVKGSTLEAWRHDGSAWSRLGSSRTRPTRAAGCAGVGMRGTTGRLDDFGARTLGAPPPDTEPPSAPGTLSASATSPSQIDLSLGSGDRQRRGDALPHRALPGSRLLELRRDRDDLLDELPEHRPQRLDRVLLPRARRRTPSPTSGTTRTRRARRLSRLPTPSRRALREP